MSRISTMLTVIVVISMKSTMSEAVNEEKNLN
jgi:hypothetical protein